MKIRRLTLGEKTYEITKITAYTARKALEINTDAVAFINSQIRADGSEDPTIKEIEAQLRKRAEIRDRKAWLVCKAYGEKFSMDELEQALTNEEIDAEVVGIANGIFEEIEKNA